MPLHRTLKNVVKNFTPAEVKVREATSNDPWGPTTTLMNEIAELTHSSLAFPEVMNMIWKRLSDQGKNWRHVLKALNLLEYLAKVGSHQVAEQCKSHIHLIQMLGEFQHFEEGKDWGAGIREKSKQFVSLLKDSERFKNERSKALVAKERLAQSAGMGSTTRRMTHSTSDRYLSTSARGTTTLPPLSSEFEAARPSSYGEEDLQLQLALAMSKEEHEGELKRRKDDEFKLQMALEESKKISNEFQKTLQSFNQDFMEQSSITSGPLISQTSPPKQQQQASLLFPSSSTWESGLNHSSSPPSTDPWGLPTIPPQTIAADPWGTPIVNNNVAAAAMNNEGIISNDPWSPTPGAAASAMGADGWNTLLNNKQQAGLLNNQQQQPQHQSPLHGSFQQQQQQQHSVNPKDQLDDEFDLLCNRTSTTTTNAQNGQQATNDPLGGLGEDLLSGTLWSTWANSGGGLNEQGDDQSKKKLKSVEEFLGENSSLVNLNDLISRPPPSTIANPFMMTSLSTRPSANQAAASLPTTYGGEGLMNPWPATIGLNQPMMPVNQTQPFVPLKNYPQQNNPFL